MREFILNTILFLTGVMPFSILIFIFIKWNELSKGAVHGMVVTMFLLIVVTIIVKEEIYDK